MESNQALFDKYAARFHWPASMHYKSVEDLASGVHPDAALIFTPTAGHTKAVEECAKFHIHAMMEKPLAVSYKDALVMKAAAERGKIHVLVDYETTWYGSNKAAHDLLEQGAQQIAARAPERLVRERDRLRGAVAQLLDGRTVDEERLAQELAFLADKLDITEELVRFKAHATAVREALTSDEPIGKRLGFLAQELGREVNTMGSKAGDAEIAQHVVAMKGELEKFREQLENLE